MLLWDTRLQYRYGIYAVYAILTLAFIIGLRSISPEFRTDAAVLLIALDPTVLGFYFIAAMVLFEKREGVLDSLAVSPLGCRGYLLSKVMTLTLLAVFASVLVAALGHGISARLPMLVVGTSLAASLFVLIGFIAVARFNSINEYFISAVGWGTILFLPLFGYVGIVESRLFYLLPAQPVLLLIEGGFRPLGAWEIGYGVGYLTIGNGIAYVWARHSFRTQIVRGETPNSKRWRHSTATGANSTTLRRWKSHSPIVGMVRADLRNWLRDPMLAIAAVGPLVLALGIRFGMPAVSEMASPIIILERYYPVIAGSMTVFGPAIYGFVIGMFVLEDREQGVLVAFRTSPLSAKGYFVYRCVTAFVISLFATLPALATIGVVDVPWNVFIGSIVVGGLVAPTVALSFGTFASNTIEGLALSKVINLVVLGPAVIIAVVPTPIQFVGGVIPTFWPVKTYVAGAAGESLWIVFAAVGIGLNMAVLYVLGILFLRRVD